MICVTARGLPREQDCCWRRRQRTVTVTAPAVTAIAPAPAVTAIARAPAVTAIAPAPAATAIAMHGPTDTSLPPRAELRKATYPNQGAGK